jgi:hypothetical protein
MNRINHFEFQVSNPEKSLSFFKNVFGWEFQKFGEEDYWVRDYR